MLSDPTRGTLICFIGMLVAASTFLGAIKVASARDDSGVLGVFSSMFGAHQDETAPVSVPPQAQPPLVQSPLVQPMASSKHRLHFTSEIPNAKHRTRTANSGKITRATRTGKVSILEDKTLRRGDAVMTAKGLRIFAGSNSWPYRNSDFVALAEAPRMNKSQQTILLDLDRLPHG